jgi:hypothetical protein
MANISNIKIAKGLREVARLFDKQVANQVRVRVLTCNK